MAELPHRAGQPTTDLPEAFGLSQLAEEHCYKMIPRTVTLTISFCPVFSHHLVKFRAAEESDQLTEDACKAYRVLSPPRFVGVP